MTAPWPDHLLTLAEWDALSVDSGWHELVEGVLLVVPRPAPRHQRAVVRLASQLDGCLPDDLAALAEVEVLVDAGHPATVRVPDVVVVAAPRVDGPPRLLAQEVLLAVEVLSPGTGRTDRITKLTEYADAAIPGYWVVDLDDGPTLTAYTLVDGDYEVVAEGSGMLDLEHPAPLRVDVGALVGRR